MSFKREGNDGSLLGVLRKRRIKDLLSEDIPEDEAKLLSNGRLACLVCGNHPIFDTVNMLSMHRHGKKHKHYQDIHDAKKQELKSLIRKRQQEEILKYGKTSISMKMALSKTGLGQAPYNPCVKKGRAKAGERKQCLDLSPNDALDNPAAVEAGTSTDSSNSMIPSSWRDVCEQQVSGPVLHDKQLKNIFKVKGTHQTDVRITPYQRSRAPGTSERLPGPSYGNLSEDHGQCDSGTSFSTLSHTQTIPSSSSSFPQLNSDYSINNHYYSDIQHLGNSSGLGKVSSVIIKHSEFSASCTMRNSRNETQSDLPTQASQEKNEDKKQTNQSASCSTQSQSKPNTNRNARDKDLAAKYRLLQGSGWKKDWDGKWIRDENAEFDSDEEPPDLP